MKDFLTFTHISIDIDLYETICGYKTGKKYGRKLKKKKVHVLSNLFFFFSVPHYDLVILGICSSPFHAGRGADGIKYSLACSTGAAMEQYFLVPHRQYQLHIH